MTAYIYPAAGMAHTAEGVSEWTNMNMSLVAANLSTWAEWATIVATFLAAAVLVRAVYWHYGHGGDDG